MYIVHTHATQWYASLGGHVLFCKFLFCSSTRWLWSQQLRDREEQPVPCGLLVCAPRCQCYCSRVTFRDPINPVSIFRPALPTFKFKRYTKLESPIPESSVFCREGALCQSMQSTTDLCDCPGKMSLYFHFFLNNLKTSKAETSTGKLCYIQLHSQWVAIHTMAQN